MSDKLQFVEVGAMKAFWRNQRQIEGSPDQAGCSDLALSLSAMKKFYTAKR
jgi:hypothetical protein